MKRYLAVLLAILTLITSCGPATGNDTATANETNASSPDTPPAETEVIEPDVTEKVEREDFSIQVKEDAYVLNQDGSGDQKSSNFGSETLIDVKTTGGSLTRFGYVKFDISELIGNEDFTCIDLDLTVLWRQVDPTTSQFARVEIYSCDTSWQENTLTFNSQPEEYSLVTALDDITDKTETRSFPVTAYIKNAIKNGKTEVAFVIKEDTDDCDIRIHLASKENGENAPKLSVYHGTKVDEAAYEGIMSEDPEVSKNGLDSIIGLNQNQSATNTIEAIEDTYVEAGISAETNFGAAAHLDYKACSGVENAYYRIALIKFDISEINEFDFNYAELLLNCTSIENETVPTTLNVYQCFAYDWDENKVTYNTRPEREGLIATTTVYGIGNVRLDITDYMKKVKDTGLQQISFWLEGDIGTVRRLNFASRESGNGAPQILFNDGASKIQTYLKYDGVNPWEYAMENVSDWINRWEVIKAGGDTDIETIEKDGAEYSLSVGATRSPNGANTKYTQYPTRTINTLKGYTASTAETAKYDIYGGLMDESMRQEATGFFYTKKVGDRWWTFDPLGYPFYRTAVVAIVMGSGSNQVAKFTAKYGTAENWAQKTTDRLWELGYNSTGGWSSTANLIKANKPLAQTSILYALKNYCNKKGLDISKSGSTALLHGLLPVFDPEFVESTDAIVKSAVKDYATSSYIYGWMGDNELPATLSMLDSSLFIDTSDSRFSYTYATAWTFIYLRTGKTNINSSEITDELRKEYRAMVYDRYFKVVCEALDRYAPYQQFMGCRFVDGCFKDEFVIRVAGYWCDVISYNYYGVWEPDAELIASQQKWAGKPFIITEWYAKGMDVWEQDNRMTNASGAGWSVKDQKDRGLFYQNYALQLLECKGCVGFDWFQFLDNDPENLSADESNRNANKGIYDNYANEYTVLTEYMTELNNQKDNLVKYFDER